MSKRRQFDIDQFIIECEADEFLYGFDETVDRDMESQLRNRKQEDDDPNNWMVGYFAER